MVDAAIIADALDPNGIVIDIGRAHDALRAILAPINYRNLDEIDLFKGVNTTTEVLCKAYFRFAGRDRAGGRPWARGPGLRAIRVTISESHLARAWYEQPLW